MKSIAFSKCSPRFLAFSVEAASSLSMIHHWQRSAAIVHLALSRTVAGAGCCREFGHTAGTVEANHTAPRRNTATTAER
ncbi:MAG: hypothetical protein JO015_19815 [Verrucomicrobia bacterium]|nr:hypothetical protein [Verrucomicrobiota bacterium]